MRLGIDFGTTRIVVAAADRGNYPVLQFESTDGGIYDWFPPLVALRGQERRYGWDAWALQTEPGWTILRSIKRILGDSGPLTQIQYESGSASLSVILQELTASLRRAILETSNLPKDADKLEAQLGVPANANTNQRFLTAEAFRTGGFEVLGLLNEPSAASLEYSHNHPSGTLDERFVLVYDLGGGTFDASLLSVIGERHEVLASEGVSTLGGDDFDDILAEMALEAAGVAEADRDALGQTPWFRLREECRQKKEAIKANSRRIVIDLEPLGMGTAVVSVDEFYERASALVDETMHAVDDALERNGFSPDGVRERDGARLETVYVAGGGSELPLVPRVLRDRFARRVKRSAHGRSSTAIGLAVQADGAKNYSLRDRFTRYFGVYREADEGKTVTFDPLFGRDTQLPAAGEPPLSIERGYTPAHNVGHFRYLECSKLADDGSPAGDVTLWDEILFPLDPALADVEDLAGRPVVRCPAALEQKIEERYSCDSAGRLAVQIANTSRGYQRTFRLGRWATSVKTLTPGKRSRRKAATKKAPKTGG
ncbi:MAG: Hsp70 family protein [Bryobacterales bacterium]